MSIWLQNIKFTDPTISEKVSKWNCGHQSLITGKDDQNLAFLFNLHPFGFQSQFERKSDPRSVTTPSLRGFMLAKSIRPLEWGLRIPCAAVPVICVCHLLFPLTLLLPLCLLSPLDDTSYFCLPLSASLRPCLLCALSAFPSVISFSIDSVIYSFDQGRVRRREWGWASHFFIFSWIPQIELL